MTENQEKRFNMLIEYLREAMDVKTPDMKGNSERIEKICKEIDRLLAL